MFCWSIPLRTRPPLRFFANLKHGGGESLDEIPQLRRGRPSAACRLDGLNAVKAWLTHAHATARIIEENYGHIENEKDRLTATVEENVLVQIESLRTHPSVAAAASRGDLKLHGWTYEFETGRVFAYKTEQEQFLPVQQVVGTPKPVTLRMPAI